MGSATNKLEMLWKRGPRGRASNEQQGYILSLGYLATIY